MYTAVIGAVYMEGGTGRLPGRDVFYPGIKSCLCGRRDGIFSGPFIPGLHENIFTRDDFTGDYLRSQHNIVPAKRDGVFI